ncbi:MAG TPA: tetraacyldisaccharide 4'-kinase, partial [Xanthomonadaceae bacterium]|nr:tetraacyldisaccharide 4'-kinase [Xanthomonadaceae bacterium]
MAKNDAPDWWYDERIAVPGGARALTPAYAGVTALRRWMYRHRLLRAHAAGVPVVVVGNLTAGGSGKTPLTIALVQRLVRAG